MMYGIYLSADNDSEGFRLPVLPEIVSVKSAGDGETFKIAKLGTVNVPKDADLKEFPIESFFPGQAYHFSETDFKEPQFYIDKIEKWKAAKKPIRYIYVNGSFLINDLVMIENFDFNEGFGSTDVYFNLELMKFVPFGPKLLNIEKPKVMAVAQSTKQVAVATVKKTPPRETEKVVPQTYTLIKGDSLWKVTQKYTGNGANYVELQKLNGIKSSDLRKLPIGLKLKIPPSWVKK